MCQCHPKYEIACAFLKLVLLHHVTWNIDRKCFSNVYPSHDKSLDAQVAIGTMLLSLTNDNVILLAYRHVVAMLYMATSRNHSQSMLNTDYANIRPIMRLFNGQCHYLWPVIM